MRAGLLRRKVSVRSPVETQSALTGEITVTWSTLSSAVWASIEPMRYREQFTARQTYAKADTKITIRYLSGVSVEDKVVYDGSDYFVEGIVQPMMCTRSLELYCYKVAT